MHIRPANLMPTVLLFVACLLLTLNIYLFLYQASTKLPFVIYVAIVGLGLVFAISGLVMQVRQPRQEEDRGKQIVATASTGFLFVFFSIVAAAELILIFLLYAFLSFLQMFNGKTS